MPFKKGVSGNPAGRPPGARNKDKMRQKIESVIDANFDDIQDWINAMEPKDRAMFLLRMMEYVVPKLRSTELTSELETLSEEDLDRIIEKLTTENYEQN